MALKNQLDQNIGVVTLLNLQKLSFGKADPTDYTIVCVTQKQKITGLLNDYIHKKNPE
jgi:hypothetical protein